MRECSGQEERYKLLSHLPRRQNGADGKAEQGRGALVDVGLRRLRHDQHLVRDKALGRGCDGGVAQHGLRGGLLGILGGQHRRDARVRVRRVGAGLERRDVVEHAAVAVGRVQLSPEHLKPRFCWCSNARVGHTNVKREGKV